MGRIGAAVLLVVISGCSQDRSQMDDQPASHNDEPSRRSSAIAAAVNGIPLVFERNQGQAKQQVDFILRNPSYAMFFLRHEFTTVLLPLPGTAGSAPVVTMSFDGASEASQVVGESKLAGVANHLLGAANSHWHGAVPLYQSVRYQDIYDGTDLVVHGHSERVTYDFILQPGARPEDIQLRFSGVTGIVVDEAGNLLITLPGDRAFRHKAPVLYELVGRERIPVGGGFRLIADNLVGFTVDGRSAGRTLVIDPQIDFGSYFGGTDLEPMQIGIYGFPSSSFGIPIFDIDLSDAGHLYVAGTTRSFDLPETAEQTVDETPIVFIMRLNNTNPSAPTIDYVSYIGGSADDFGFGVTAGAGDAAYVCGTTQSSDFPVTGGAYQSSVWSPRLCHPS